MAAPSIYGAVITWTSNGEATSVVEYGLTTSYGSVATGANGTWHSVELSGLSSGTRYYYRVRSNCLPNANVTATAAGYFYTSSFSINGLTVTYTDFTSAVITWTTSCSATSTIEYGMTVAYGTNATGASGTTHSVTVTGLTPMATYHFRAMSVPDIDPTGVTYSTDRTVLTTAISNVQVSSISITSAIVTWTTSIDCTTEVRYGLTSAYGTTMNSSGGTSHSVLLTGLNPSTLYHFQVRSTSVINASQAGYSSDNTFTTRGHNDAGQNVDAGASTAAALLIVTGPFTGDLDAVYDASDYYKLYCFAGQTITSTLAVPTGYNFDLALVNPSGSVVATSTNGVGVSESISYVATATGYWLIKLYATSGAGGASYTCWLYVTGGMDDLDVDVGAANDMSAGSHLPGIYLLSSSGWGSVVNFMREGPANATFVLNLYEDSHQSSTGYLITVRYYATSDTVVQVLNNGVWVDVATLPAKTAIWSYSFVLKPEHQYDSLPEMGRNVQLRFAHALKVDHINAVAYSYITEFGSPTAYHNPGIVLENGWTLNGVIANGSSGATLLVSIPRTDIAYSLAFTYCDSTDDIPVQQYASSGYQSIGTMQRWGSTAFVQLDRNIYYDVDPNAAGMNVRIKLLLPLYNLSSVRMTPTILYTDVGVTGDNVSSSKNLGVSIYANTEWSGLTTVDGKTVRTTLNNQANFYLNAPVSGQSIRIDMYYKTSNAGVIRQWNGLSYTNVATLTADGAWHYVSAWVRANDYFDYAAGSKINALFEITSISTSVDHFYTYIDSDGDTLRDSYEIGQGTDPLSKDTDSDGLDDNIEPSYGTNPAIADCDNDGLLDGSEQWSQTWSTDIFAKTTGGGGTNYISNPIYLDLPAIDDVLTQPITAAYIQIGLMHAQTNQVRVVIWKNGDAFGTTLANRNMTGSSLFISRNLFSYGYDASDFRTACTWTLFIDDYSTCGGQLQYFKIQVDGKTNPTNADTDGDGILDGLEINTYRTNPALQDTDVDGISDYNEVHGIGTPSGQPTNPLSADNGRYLLALTLDRLNVWYAQDFWGNYVPNPSNAFLVLRNFLGVQGNDFALGAYTFPGTQSSGGTWYFYPGYTYYFEVPTDTRTVNFLLQAWTRSMPSDGQLAFCGSSNCESVSYTLGSSQTYTWSGTNLGVRLTLSTVSMQKVNTLLVNEYHDNQSYGLDQSNGWTHYGVDSQLYVVFVNVTNAANSNFVQGVNTILLPRSVALDCQLNATLSDPNNNWQSGALRLSSTTPTYATTNTANGMSSGNVIMTISVTMTLQNAETLLSQLTHSSSGTQVGKSTKITTQLIYAMNLPEDVIDIIPFQNLPSSASFTSMPGDVFSGFVNGLSNLINGVVSLATEIFITVWNLASGLANAIIDLGMQFLSAVWNTFVAQVTAAIDAIVDAFNALVQWAIEFIQNTINSLVNGMIDGLQKLGNAFCGQVQMSCNSAADEYNTTGMVSQEKMNQIATAVLGTFFISIIALGTVMAAAFIITSVVTSVFSFLIGVVLSTLLIFIVTELFGSVIEFLLGDDPLDNLSSFLTSFITGQGGDPNDQHLSAATDIVIGTFAILGEGIKKVSLPGGFSAFPKALAEAVCGLIMAIYATYMASGFGGLLFSVLGLELSISAIVDAYRGLDEAIDSNSRVAFGFTLIVSAVGAGKSAFGVWESVQEL